MRDNNNIISSSDKNNMISSSDNINIKILPGYYHAILTSNKHNKLILYNITIPQLTIDKSSNFFAFLSPKVT